MIYLLQTGNCSFNLHLPCFKAFLKKIYVLIAMNDYPPFSVKLISKTTCIYFKAVHY